MLNGNVNDNVTHNDLLKYSISDTISSNDEGGTNKESNLDENGDASNKRMRTFSETMKMLDDDIIADLNVK